MVRIQTVCGFGCGSSLFLKMKVEEVVDGTMSQCKVVQGDKKIFTAMEAFQALDEAAQKQQPLKVKATIAPLFSL